MKRISTIFFISAFAFFTKLNASESNALTWYTNLDTAAQISNKSDKPIFAFFTGSDWCGWCIKLQRNVFAKQAFIDWANENVVLLELDFPRTKPQSNELKIQNGNLQRALGVQGYPTIWIFTAQKNEELQNFNLTTWGRLGYPSGPDVIPGQEEVKFLADANAVLAKKPAKSTDTN